MKRTNQRKDSKAKSVFLFCAMLIGFGIINMLIVRTSTVSSIRTVSGQSWDEERDAGVAAEAETLERLKKGTPPPQPDHLEYTLPKLDFFSNEAWLNERMIVLPKNDNDPDAQGQFYAHSPNAETATKEMLGHAIHEISRCREFVNFNTTPMGEWNEKALMELSLSYMQSLAPALFRPNLKHRFICTISSFWSNETYQANGQRLRFRLAMSYTDLELLTFLFQNDGPEHKKFGVKEAAQLTPSIFAAYNLCLKVVEKAKQQVDKQIGKGASESDRQYAMAQLLHDYLCHNCEYSGVAAAENNRFMLTRTILAKRASSEGYARAYSLLLTIAGIPNGYVYGKIRYKDAGGNTKSAPRCWNIVSTDGQTWFPVDVAADDPIPSAMSLFSHVYFGMPSSLFTLSHSATEVYLPRGMEGRTDIIYNDSAWYFGKVLAPVSSAEELAEKAVTLAGKGILAGEFLYMGRGITATEMNNAIQRYMEEKQFLFDTKFRMEMDTQTLADSCHIVRVTLHPDLN